MFFFFFKDLQTYVPLRPRPYVFFSRAKEQGFLRIVFQRPNRDIKQDFLKISFQGPTEVPTKNFKEYCLALKKKFLIIFFQALTVVSVFFQGPTGLPTRTIEVFSRERSRFVFRIFLFQRPT